MSRYLKARFLAATSIIVNSSYADKLNASQAQADGFIEALRASGKLLQAERDVLM